MICLYLTTELNFCQYFLLFFFFHKLISPFYTVFQGHFYAQSTIYYNNSQNRSSLFNRKKLFHRNLAKKFFYDFFRQLISISFYDTMQLIRWVN